LYENLSAEEMYQREYVNQGHHTSYSHSEVVPPEDDIFNVEDEEQPLFGRHGQPLADNNQQLVVFDYGPNVHNSALDICRMCTSPFYGEKPEYCDLCGYITADDCPFCGFPIDDDQYWDTSAYDRTFCWGCTTELCGNK